jgi:hypothetical protein
MNPKARRQQQAFLLRLPQSLKEHLKQQAKANSRSLNSEILARLEAGWDSYTSQSDDLVARKLL